MPPRRGTSRNPKDEAARKLAQAHYSVEEGLSRIFRLKAPGRAESHAQEPIKLLEVNALTVPSGIMPLHFGPVPSLGIPFSTIIVEVTPDEFDQIQSGMALPNGWVLGEELPRLAT